jgi:hypothetical protein
MKIEQKVRASKKTNDEAIPLFLRYHKESGFVELDVNGELILINEKDLLMFVRCLKAMHENG